MKNLKHFTKEDGTLYVFVTGQCNQRCITCPQELSILPTDVDRFHRELSETDFSDVRACYLTGGEPLLSQNLVADTLERVPPAIPIYLLTNGSISPNESLLADRRVIFCVSLFSPRASVHDRLIGTQAWSKVMSNLYLLGSVYARIELRIVLGSYNHGDLREYAHFIAMNLPFISTVSFMGMEIVEQASVNRDRLWISQSAFVPEIIAACSFLDSVGIECSVYNFPLCLFPSSFSPKIKKTISNWKRTFIEKCQNCQKQADCGGFFNTNIELVNDREA